MKNKIILGLLLMVFLAPKSLFSFCGFYVSKVDAKLFNKASQVILVRDGKQNVVTMSNDFYGNVQDFAMVVPVPTVLKEKDIKVVNSYIFDKLDAYTGPRLVEYFDQNPCYEYLKKELSRSVAPTTSNTMADIVVEEEEALGVTIEASYSIGEYDILILSALESSGLKTWLNTNGYKIPENAEEVLDPYIKSNLKFFVVKVNLEAHSSSGFDNLRPLQIAYESDRFMLPIRLGMANAETTQDMIVYAFTKNGRVETTNYRTTKIPTDKNIPTFVQNNFSQFYKDAFDKAYERNGKNAVFLEYSWDLSSSNYTKCDPCSTTPPTYSELKDAGVFWAQQGYNNQWGGADYSGELFITRLHVKYDRENFPQDLFFQATPNKEFFQGRYVLNHPVTGPINCEGAEDYYKEVLNRREDELDELAYLTGWDTKEYDYYTSTFEKKYKRAKNDNADSKKGNLLPLIKIGGGNNTPTLTFVLFSLVSFLLLSLTSIYFTQLPKYRVPNP